MMLQSTGVLEKKLEDEEKLLAEVQRDKDRYDQRQQLERQVWAPLSVFLAGRTLQIST